MSTYKHLFILLFSGMIFIHACTEDQSSATKTGGASADTLSDAITDIAPDTIPYQIRELEKRQPDCEGDECTIIKVKYPFFSTEKNRHVGIINQQIEATLNEMLGGYQPDDQIPPQPNLDQMTQGIIDDFMRMKSEYPEERPWSIEIDGYVVFQDEEVVSLAFSSYDYMGGVHPNSAQKNLCINPQTGNLFMLDELITDFDQLTQLGEKAFRKEAELGDQDDLSSSGYDFPDNKFGLNENFLLTDEGIHFHYNPYEIAAYVMGHTDILITYEELEAILKE